MATVEINLICAVCKNELTAEQVLSTAYHVEPCERCMTDAEEEGYGRAKEEVASNG